MEDKILDLVFDTTPFPMWIKSAEGKFLRINNKFKDAYVKDKFTKESIKGKNSVDIFSIEESKRYDKIHELVVNKKEPITNESIINGKIIQAFLTPIIDENNNVIAVSGIVKDVTKDRKYKKEIIEQKVLLETIIDTIPDMIFYKDKDSRYIGGNEAFTQGFFGLEKEEVIGKTDLDLHPNKDIAKSFIEKDKEILKSKERYNTKVKLINKNKEVVYVESVKAPLINEDGEAWGIVGISRDMTERKLLEEKLTALSYTDKLTGLYNRASFEEQISKLDNSQYYPLSLIMGDVNGLKLVNDTLGHIEGDKLLIDISKAIKESCGNNELIFRWGGDEIIILLPNTSYEEAEIVCKNIHTSCKKNSCGPVPLSISLGLSTKLNSKVNINKILKEAEDMLYKEKFLLSKSSKNPIIR